MFLCMCVHAQSLNHVWLFATPQTMACQDPWSMEFSRQEYWILEWLAISYSRRYSQPSNWTWVSALAGRFFTTELPEKPFMYIQAKIYILLYSILTNGAMLYKPFAPCCVPHPPPPLNTISWKHFLLRVQRAFSVLFSWLQSFILYECSVIYLVPLKEV